MVSPPRHCEASSSYLGSSQFASNQFGIGHCGVGQVIRNTREGGGPSAHPLVTRFVLWLVSGRFGDNGRVGHNRLSDVDRLAATLLAELHRAGDEGEERVIATTPNSDTGVEVRTALADDDLASVDNLAAETLDAKVLGVRVAPVARRRCTLFVCHVSACLWFSYLQ
jgi:hypothetical protein